MRDETFKSLVKEIHRVNKGWHCFEISNRFLESEDKYLQNYYLQQKNALQKQLQEEYKEMIRILDEDETGFKSIGIRKDYRFKSLEGIFYNDACHIEKEEQ
jgi:hypothetical protein